MNLLNSINSSNPPSQPVIIDTYIPFFTVSLITANTLRVTIINKIDKYPIYRLYSGGVLYGSVLSIGVINATGFTQNTSYDLTVVASNTTNPATTTLMKTSAITTITTLTTLYTNASTSSNAYVTYIANTQTVTGITDPAYIYCNGDYEFSNMKNLTNGYLTGNTTNVTNIGLQWFRSAYFGATLKGYFNNIDGNLPTTVDGVSVYGAWYQVKLPYYIYISSYYIGSSSGVYVIPLEWKMVGSNDGINFTQLDSPVIAFGTQTAASTNKTFTLPSMTTVAYKYIRLIIIRISNSTPANGNNVCNITKFYANGTAYTPI